MRLKSPVEWLKSVRAFEAMPETVLKRIYGECHLQSMSRGDVLFKAGEEGAALYIVTSGRFRTTRPTEPGKSELGPGAVLGEKAFLTRAPHDATVTSVRTSIVLKLEWESFKALAEGAPEIWQATIAGLLDTENRMYAQPRLPVDRARSIAICPAGNDTLPAAFAHQLAAALEQRAECQVLSSEGLGQNLPGGIALDDPQVIHWLKEQEAKFEVIILLADPEPTPWTEKAIAEADEICLIGSHDGGRLGQPVPLSTTEELAFEIRGPAACRLALLHDPRRGAVVGARRWLEYRPVRSHHHLRLGQPKDFDRLARFLLGQSTGYFATAPGVLGAAALGIFKAVQAAGFEPDCFGGTGAGAVMAACLALGMDPDDIDHLVTEIMIERRGLRRRSRPVFGLYDQRALDRLILKHIPDTDLADLPVPYYAASTNFSTGQPHIHRTGNLQVAVRANWPFPGLLPPFIDEEGQMLGDGTILRPPPLAPMHQMNSGPNVVARVSVPPFGKSQVRYRDIPAWQTVARHPLPWKRDTRASGLPSFENFMVMASQGGAVAGSEWLGPLDMLLAPPIPATLDVLAWRDHGRLKDMSYQWALGELEKRAAAGELPLVAAVPST